jgi:iron complex outermembrane receptor protein
MLSRLFSAPALALAGLLSCSLARSQDLSPTGADESILFQDIPSVYSASKFEQKTSEAPSSVSIVTAVEFLVKATCHF